MLFHKKSSLISLILSENKSVRKNNCFNWIASASPRNDNLVFVSGYVPKCTLHCHCEPEGRGNPVFYSLLFPNYDL